MLTVPCDTQLLKVEPGPGVVTRCVYSVSVVGSMRARISELSPATTAAVGPAGSLPV